MTSTQDIEQMRSQRFQFLHRCYEISGADELRHLSMFDVGKELGFDKSVTMRIVQYLEGEGLIKFRTMGGGIAISHRGVVHMERALSEPDAPTEYFPAVINIISAEQILDSQIQQASPAATQAAFRQDKDQELREFIESLRNSLEELGLDDQQKSDLQAEILTMEAQASKSKPNRAIITESLKSAWRILEEAAGGALAVGIIETIKFLLGG